MQKLLSKYNIYLIAILTIGAIFRFYGINWDQGHYLHPDERAIIMFTTPLQFPKTLDEFLSPESPMNPHFFAYGNFPLYLLKAASSLLGNINIELSSYEKMYLVGRAISALADIGTIILIFLIGKRIGGKSVGLLASFFYTIAVFPIQASHFFAVDILLTFFITLALYRLLIFYEKPSVKNAFFIGVCFGLALVTKISAMILFISIAVAIAAAYKSRNLKQLIQSFLIIIAAAGMTFILLQPYALIDSKEFIKQNLLQSEMTHNAFIFPYTLQYVGKIPYFYELKNVFLWGLGPVLASLAFIGVFYFLSGAKELILFVFFLAYFITVGKFAVGWMRYMLPLYPIFCLFAAVMFLRILSFIPPSYRLILNTLYFILIIVWPLSFMHIYTFPHTRIAATEWIQKNIPANATLAVEHWDDRLPLSGGETYQFIEMTLYEQPDDEKKWVALNQKLIEADYIILSSNRLYTPLPKLADCAKYKSCYPKTAKYYQDLFNESLGFQKVAEFTSFPTIPLLNIPIDDQGADEAFTVYDHPKVMIFKKTT